MRDRRIQTMRYDARKECWQPMSIKGVTGYFNDCRIDRNTVPDIFHFWELADGDSDGNPCRYKPGILVNFYGTFITTGEMPIEYTKCQEGFIESDSEWIFIGNRSLTFEEMMQREKGGAENDPTE
jgi:hypothetical protein